MVGTLQSLADDSNWGTAESEALRWKTHSRLLSYAEADAKAELTQTLDRLEISRILEEFLKRQRSIQATPEGELLAIRMNWLRRSPGRASERSTATNSRRTCLSA